MEARAYTDREGDALSSDITYHVLGDVHGHADQLEAMLDTLGYLRPDPVGDPLLWRAPPNCQLISIGDLVDRGPDSLRCLLILKRMVEDGSARLVLGNHDWKFRGLLREALGLAPARARVPASRVHSRLQILALPDDEKEAILEFIETTPRYLVDAERDLIFVHACWDRSFVRLEGEALVQACAFGRSDVLTAGDPDEPDEPDEPGPPAPAGQPLVDLDVGATLPSRARWARSWRGPETVFWGHQVVVRGAVARIGRTVNVESGCFEGHALSVYVHPDARVVQTHGGRPWRHILRDYRPVHGVVLPADLEAVRSNVEENRIGAADEYLLWLQLECEDAGAPPLFPALERTHAGLFERCRT